MTNHTPYDAIATICQRTGRQCPAALSAADQLARAASLACATEPAFCMTGQLMLEGCAQGCAAQFTLNGTHIELFCGVEADVDIAALCAFSDSFLGTGKALHGIGKLDTPPQAIVRKYITPSMAPQTAQFAVTG